MSNDLVKRLRDYAGDVGHYATMKEAADRIEALEKALRPFAELGEAWLPVDNGDNSIFVTCPDNTPVNNITNFGFTFGSFRNAARAALEGKDD